MKDNCTYVDLYDIVPNAKTDCTNAGYSKAERENVTPALIEAGYEVGAWFDGERDSFGPLSRCVNISKDGKTVTAVYG